MNLRVGILGAGAMGAAHARAYRTAGAEIVGVADVDESAAARLANSCGARPVTAPEALFDLGLDAVSICVPHNLHSHCALMACARGVHVLIEKPLAISMAEALEMRNACRNSHIRFMMGFSQRFQAGFRDLKQAIQRDALGSIVFSADYLSAGPWVPDWYLQRTAAGGGILITGSIHAVDRLRWLIGSEVACVRAMAGGRSESAGVERTGAILLDFHSGAQAALIGYRSPLQFHKRTHWFEIHGTQGEAMVDLSEGSIARSLRIATSRETQEWTYPSDDPFETEIAEFVEAIQSQRDPTPGVEDGLVSLAVILAAYESARSGRAVDFRAWQKAYKPC